MAQERAEQLHDPEASVYWAVDWLAFENKGVDYELVVLVPERVFEVSTLTMEELTAYRELLLNGPSSRKERFFTEFLHESMELYFKVGGAEKVEENMWSPAMFTTPSENFNIYNQPPYDRIIASVLQSSDDYTFEDIAYFLSGIAQRIADENSLFSQSKSILANFAKAVEKGGDGFIERVSALAKHYSFDSSVAASIISQIFASADVNPGWAAYAKSCKQNFYYSGEPNSNLVLCDSYLYWLYRKVRRGRDADDIAVRRKGIKRVELDRESAQLVVSEQQLSDLT